MPHWPPQYGERVPLWDAVYAQDIVTMQKLLASPSGVEQSALAKNLILNAACLMYWVSFPVATAQIWQQTSVHLAVNKGNSKILKTLLFVANVNVNARAINGATPLHLALERNRKDMVQDLLLVGANPLLINHTGKNAIAMARDKGLADVSSMLYQYVENQPFQEGLKAQQQQLQSQQQPYKTKP